MNTVINGVVDGVVAGEAIVLPTVVTVPPVFVAGGVTVSFIVGAGVTTPHPDVSGPVSSVVVTVSKLNTFKF